MKKLKNNFKKNFFENNAWQNSFYVCGIDEVGRGCLAGPLVTATVILPHNTNCELLKDSKILTPQQRQIAYDWITNNCFYSVSIFSHKQVDRLNIYQATLQCMKKSLLQLLQILPFDLKQIKYVLVDAMPLNLSGCNFCDHLEVNFFDKGESKSNSIAAASIVAKVTRDLLMKKMSTIFPDFNFDENKGYGTSNHMDVLRKHGPTIIHRKTFMPKVFRGEVKEQVTIF